MISRLKPRRSVHRRYMRSSISAQSCDSVPPAPGWMVTIAFLRSCSPPSIFLISPACTSWSSASSACANSASTGFARLGPLDEHREVVALLLERHDEIAVLLEPAAALQDFLRFGLVFPEIGRGGARLEAGQFFVGAGAFKDSSADRQHAC